VRRAGPAWQRTIAAWLPRAAQLPRIKSVVGTARRRPDSVVSPLAPAARQPRAARPPSRPSRPPPDSLVPPARHLAPHAAAPTAFVPTEAVRSRVARTVVVPPRPPRRSPVTVAPRRRPGADEPPVSSAVSRAAVGSPCSTAAGRAFTPCAARCAGRSSWVARAAPSEGNPGRPRVAVGCAPAWPRAAPSLCDYAERDFGPVALGLDFIFSEYIQFLANSKICVEFI
jgi:hypothetical protein